MSINLIIDIVLLVVALFIIIKFTVKGFLKSVLDSLKIVLAVVIAFLARIPVAKMFQSMFMDKKAIEWVKNSLENTIAGESGAFNLVELYNDAPGFFTNILSKFGIDIGIVDTGFADIENASGELVDSLATTIGTSISSMLSTILAVIVVFIVALIVLTIVVSILNKLTNIGAIKFINRVLGLALGVVISFVVLWALCLGVQALVDFVGPIAPDILNQEAVDQSVVMGFFKKINLIDWVTKLINK